MREERFELVMGKVGSDANSKVWILLQKVGPPVHEDVQYRLEQPKVFCSHPEPTVVVRSRPESSKVEVEVVRSCLKLPGVIWRRPESSKVIRSRSELSVVVRSRPELSKVEVVHSRPELSGAVRSRPELSVVIQSRP